MKGLIDMLCFTSVVANNKVCSIDMLETCIAKIAENDTQALADLYKYTKTAVYSFALSILKNTQDAEDVLHDCYINVYMAAADYQSIGKPMAWILTITRNLCLQKFREYKRTKDVPQENWEPYLENHAEITIEDKMLLQHCMAQLSDDERQILCLHIIAGCKHREIAEMLNLLLPTVLSKYHRALKKLKKYLLKESGNDDK